MSKCIVIWCHTCWWLQHLLESWHLSWWIWILASPFGAAVCYHWWLQQSWNIQIKSLNKTNKYQTVTLLTTSNIDAYTYGHACSLSMVHVDLAIYSYLCVLTFLLVVVQWWCLSWSQRWWPVQQPVVQGTRPPAHTVSTLCVCVNNKYTPYNTVVYISHTHTPYVVWDLECWVLDGRNLKFVLYNDILATQLLHTHYHEAGC